MTSFLRPASCQKYSCAPLLHTCFSCWESSDLHPGHSFLNVLGIRQTLSVWGRPRDASHCIPATPNSDPGGGFESNLVPSVGWYGCFKRRNILLAGYSPLPFLSINQSVRVSKTVRRSPRAINSRPSVRITSNGCMPRCIIFVTPDHQNIHTSTGFDAGRLAYSLPYVG